MSNLLLNKSFGEQVKKEVTETNPSFWKSAAIDAVALLSAVILGYFFKLFVSNQTIPGLGLIPSFWTIFTLLSIFFLASLFQLVLVKDGGRRIGIQIIQVLALGFFLYDESTRWLITESVAITLILAGSWRARSELANTLNVRFFRVANLYFSRLVLALALMATIFYFPYWQTHKTIIPQSTFEGIVSWSLGMAQSFYPDLNLTPNSTFSEIVSSLAEAQLARTPGVEQLPLAERARIKTQAMEAVAEQLRSQLGGVNPTEDESLGDFLYRYMTQGIQQLQDRFSQWFFIGWVVVVLFFFFSLGRLYALLISGIAFLIFQILLASRFLNLYVGTVSKETVDF